MKIGIISDIHGDYESLQIALDSLDKHHQVARILCAGDLIGRGSDHDQVVTLIRELGIPTVRGNHDDWSVELSDDNAAYLKNLPVDWQGRLNGRTIFMCHGKPGNNLWGLYRDHLSRTYLNMMLSSLGVDVLITGHTHIPLYVRVKEGCVVNPGSVFTLESERGSSETYGVLNLDDLAFDLYDLTATLVEPHTL